MAEEIQDIKEIDESLESIYKRSDFDSKPNATEPSFLEQENQDINNKDNQIQKKITEQDNQDKKEEPQKEEPKEQKPLTEEELKKKEEDEELKIIKEKYEKDSNEHKPNIWLTVIISVVILTGIIIAFAIIFNSGDKAEPENGLPNGDPPVIPDTNDTNNGDLENGDNSEIELQPNYLFTIDVSDNFGDSQFILKLDWASESQYNYEQTNISFVNTEEQLYNIIGINAFGMMLLPFMYGPALNRDFCEAYYNSYLDNGGNIDELLIFYDTDNIDVENIDVEAFCELPRQWILSDFYEEDLFDDVSPVIKKIFDSDMDMRNIIISTEVIYENPDTGETETYPAGEFKYLGNEKKFYSHVCDINGECVNIFNPDEEWIHLDNISTIFENELE